MIGNVANDGSQYNASGNYTSVWDFSARAGTVDINFDNESYSGEVSGTTTDSSITGTFNNDVSPVNGNYSGELQGSFYGPTGNAQAGSFSITGSNNNGGGYNAAGTFVGEE